MKLNIFISDRLKRGSFYNSYGDELVDFWDFEILDQNWTGK